MKKLWLFFILFLMTSKVNALTYYSDYSELSDWQLEEVKEDDLTKVNKEIRYKWYYEEKIIGDYKEDDAYPFIDYDDYKIEEYCTKEKRDDSIERNVFYLKNPKPVSYVYLNKVSSDIEFELFDIYAGDNKIDYKIYKCTNCIYDDNKLKGIKKDGEAILYLKGPYSPGTLRFEIETPTESNYYISLSMEDDNYYQYSSVIKRRFAYIDLNDFHLVHPAYYTEYRSLSDTSKYFLGMVSRSEMEYCSIIKNYRRYNLIRHYADYYMIDGSDEYPLVDTDDYKVYYQYSKRDYLNIPDDIIITDKSISLEDLIISNKEFKVITDMNKEVNGEYQFTVESDIIKVIDTVTINILDNNKIKDLENTISDKEKQLLENSSIINNLIKEINSLKDLNKFLDKEIVLLEASKTSDIQKYIDEIARINNKNIPSEVKIIEKEFDYNILYYLGIGLIIVSVGLSFILIIKKNN